MQNTWVLPLTFLNTFIKRMFVRIRKISSRGFPFYRCKYITLLSSFSDEIHTLREFIIISNKNFDSFKFLAMQRSSLLLNYMFCHGICFAPSVQDAILISPGRVSFPRICFVYIYLFLVVTFLQKTLDIKQRHLSSSSASDLSTYILFVNSCGHTAAR